VNWVIFTAVIGAIGVPLAVVGLVVQARAEAARKAAERETMRQTIYERGATAGRKEMQPTIDMIAYQLAEAVRERTEEKQRADMFEGRYNDLRDNKGRH
jgi:hypothetical protein